MNEQEQQAGAGPVERPVRPLGWWERRRVSRLDVKLAGLRAKLEGTNGAIRLVADGSSIPGALVHDLRELPRLIAELEETKRQIERRNAKVTGLVRNRSNDER